MPVIYATFGRQMESLIESGIIPEAFLRLHGRRACSASMRRSRSASAIRSPSRSRSSTRWASRRLAIAGERQSGTLEVLLSRPLSRRSVFLTLLLAILGDRGRHDGRGGRRDGRRRPRPTAWPASSMPATRPSCPSTRCCCWRRSRASRSRRRRRSTGSGPAIGIGLAVVLLGYVLEILGSCGRTPSSCSRYSPFHYLRPFEILGGRGDPSDLLVLLAVFAIAVAYGLWRFPRRDLAAPS